jgi:hypothetical protein
MIHGKLITLLHNTQVQNFDDIYGGLTEVFLDDLNRQLNFLFRESVVDVRSFKVTRIDFCFNVETSFVEEYLEALRRAFQGVDDGSKTDHAACHGLHGSVYIKNATEYRKNIRYNYTLNVYNKLDRLNYQRERGIPISRSDFLLAKDVLRVEVQASHGLIKDLCRNLGIEREFCALFNYEVAVYAIQLVFRRVFRIDPEWDFYTYREAKERVKGNQVAERLLYTVATNHKVGSAKYAYGRSKVTERGIYPFSVLPKGSPVPVLENPVKLIEKKVGGFL